MTLRRNDHSAEVGKLQQALLDMGYALPKWGRDDWCGGETLRAFSKFLTDHGRPVDDDPDTISDEELALVYRVRDSIRAEILPAIPKQKFFDVREQAGMLHDFGERPWSEVTGVCLHQTACSLGERPQRWATIGAHLGVSRGGLLMYMHPFDRKVVHGHRFNSNCVGIELDGMYAGIEGDLSTFWRPPWAPDLQPQAPTPELIETAKAAIRWVAAVVESHGGKLRYLVAHRQASNMRQSDPGSALWQAIAIPLHEELGLSDGGPGYRVGTGFAIPEKWDPRCKGICY